MPAIPPTRIATRRCWFNAVIICSGRPGKARTTPGNAGIPKVGLFRQNPLTSLSPALLKCFILSRVRHRLHESRDKVHPGLPFLQFVFAVNMIVWFYLGTT